MIRYIASVTTGLALGIIGARYLFVGSALSLIPWGVAGTLLGYTAKNIRDSASLGALYGFLLAFSFMIAGYAGTAPIVSRLLPFAVLGLIGAACGTVCALAGQLVRRYVAAKKEPA